MQEWGGRPRPRAPPGRALLGATGFFDPANRMFIGMAEGGSGGTSADQDLPPRLAPSGEMGKGGWDNS